MLHKMLVSIGLLFVSSFTLPVFTTTAFQASSQYAYLAIPEAGDPQIRVVAGDNPSESILQQTLSIPDDRLPPSRMILNPNGDWAAFLLGPTTSASDPRLIRLVNLTSGEIRDIGLGLLVITSVNALMSQQNIMWSPNGSYLALNLLPDSNKGTDSEVFVYSLVENRLINLTEDQHNQAHIAWSSDSTRIVTRRDDCSSITQYNFLATGH